MLKERDDVGEGFVERGAIEARCLGEMLPNSVQDRVRDLVCDNVMREAGENDLPRQLSNIAGLVAKIAEQHRSQVRIVEGVSLLEGVGKDAQMSTQQIAGVAAARPAPLDRPPE